MGCGKSKHDVAAGNTITRKKSDVGSSNNNKDLEPAVEETSPHDSNANILKEQKEEHIPSQEPSKEVVAGVQDENVEAVAGVQDANVEAVAGVQDANVEAVAGVQDANAEAVAGVQDENVEAVAGLQDANVEAVAGVQDANVEAVAGVQDGNVESVAGVQDANAEAIAGVQDANVEAVADVQDANVEVVSVLQNANESEELKGGGKDVEIEEESVVEKQEPGKLVSEEAVAGVHDANVEVVSAVQNANDESEELNGGGKDVEIKEESAAEKQEPGKLVSEESPDTVSDGKSEKESLSNESAELDDAGKETSVEKEPKQAAENEEPQATKQEIADVEPEVANPITAELEVASPTTN